MAILCIGQSAFDITFMVDDKIVEDKKYICSKQTYSAGGPAFNAAYLCALWNEKTYLISRIAEDEYGDRLRQHLYEVGVDFEHLIESEGIITPFSYIAINPNNGHRTIFNFPTDTTQGVCTFPSKPVDVILTDGKEVSISKEAFAKYPDAIKIIDAGSLRDATFEIAKLVDYLVCSRVFAEQFLGEILTLENYDNLKKQFNKIKAEFNNDLIITLGEYGVLYEVENTLHKMEAYHTKSIDTCGAGDIFHGAFAYAIANNIPKLEALKLASLTASISTEKIGSQSSIPRLEDVLSRT